MKKPKLVVPPHNLEAEQAVLAGILINNKIIDDLIVILKPGDFYRESHDYIFRSIITLYEKGIHVDLISLSDILKRQGLLSKAGGQEYLASLADAVSTSAGFKYHADLIRESSIRRHLMFACLEIHQKCLQSHDETNELLDLAEQSIFDLANARTKQGLEPISDVLNNSNKVIERSRSGRMTGISTHYMDIDRITGGLQPKELIILAARPGMGKTTLALNIAQNMANEEACVAIFSLEMSKEQLGLRLMASEGRVDAFKLRVGRLGGDDFESLFKAADRIARLPIFIDDTPDINVLEIRAKIRRLEQQQRISLIIIDYLQLMKPITSRNSREREVSEISSGLKTLAKIFEVPVMALSQLNRRVEGRDTKIPELADLRESGSIEQDADVIAFIYRPDVYNKTTVNHGKAEIIVAKNRNGPIGNIKLTYIDRYTRFENFYEPDD
jgi:replicative DNA helicase